MKEWEHEPNRKHWIDAETGLDCLIVRNGSMGNLCGYVGVPQGHPWHGKGYDDCDADVHGGLTYANECNGHICHHTPEDAVANENVWWIGFDCAHGGDLIPKMRDLHVSIGGYSVYRNIAYVETECAKLAAQVVAAR